MEIKENQNSCLFQFFVQHKCNWIKTFFVDLMFHVACFQGEIHTRLSFFWGLIQPVILIGFVRYQLYMQGRGVPKWSYLISNINSSLNGRWCKTTPVFFLPYSYFLLTRWIMMLKVEYSTDIVIIFINALVAKFPASVYWSTIWT